MDTDKNELNQDMVEAIREVVKEEIGNVIINQHPFFGMLESERIFMDEQERLKEHPLKGVLGHVTKVTRNDDGQKFNIKLNEQGRQFVNNIYEQQRLKESDLVIEGYIEWNDIWNEIYKRGD
jgi:hypothetical protein